jgi:hypothetical protein
MMRASQRIEPLLDELDTVPRRFPHLYLGPLSATEWIRFMVLHTRHHLDSIRRIENA